MSSYLTFTINNFDLIYTENDIDYIIMALLSSENKKICEDSNSEEVFYKLTTKELSDRLTVLGFSFENACENFQQTYIKDDYFNFIDDDFLMKDYDFEYFLKMLEIVMKYNLDYYFLREGMPWDFEQMSEEINDGDFMFLNYMLNPEYHKYILGFPVSDIRYLLQIIINIVGNDKLASYHLPGVLDGKYYKADVDYFLKAKAYNNKNYVINQKIIIITEGKSDINILSKGMDYLFPHLIDLFSFFDFNLSKAPGSAIELVKTVKAFISSGISNRVIAIVDNDTAGVEAFQTLNNIKLPDNIKVLKYPDLDRLKMYPTIGPQDKNNMNINGLAASIELYLDEKLLLFEDELSPIMRTGYNYKVCTYQGKVLHKDEIQKKFYDVYNKDKSKIDWSGIELILKEIIYSFK